MCTADDLVGCSERELQLLAAEVRQQNRLLYGKEQVEITQKQLAEFRRNNSAKEVILRQQRHDRETRAALRVLEGGQGIHTGVHAPASPDESPHVQRDQERPASGYAVGDGDTLRVLRRLRT